ncbi:MAG TPA: ISNCY family transposase [Pyrinomonadaceae bacterium]|nr:ISNCY family transposase [Pyrinomonadaceae bacterium]
MSTRQQRRAEVLTRLSAGQLSTLDAAQLLGITLRQVQRLRRRFAAQGLCSVVHGNTGRAPRNRTDPALVARLAALCGAGGIYHDFNVSHLCDLLARDEEIRLPRSTLSRLLRVAGVRAPPSRRAEVKRMRRERKSAEGMMLQIDATPFDWLESRGSRMALAAAIDDATSQVVYASFRPTEDQAGYLLMLRPIAHSYGLPRLLYHDRHTILRSPKEPTLEDELAGRRPASQFQRVVAALGITGIAALSPQAKGRIERLWRTLQDRLTKELRLASVNTLREANLFLPAFIASYNARFAQPARDPQSAWRALGEEADLHYYFSTSEERRVRRDHTIAWMGRTLQLVPGKDEPSLSSQSVEVRVSPEGEVAIYREGRRITHREVAPQAAVSAVNTRQRRHPQPSAVPDSQAEARRRGWLYGKVR